MKNYQPSQQFLELKAKMAAKMAAMMTETKVDEYFSIISPPEEGTLRRTLTRPSRRRGRCWKKYMEELMESKRKEKMGNKEGW